MRDEKDIRKDLVRASENQVCFCKLLLRECDKGTSKANMALVKELQQSLDDAQKKVKIFKAELNAIK